jgi:hypothetical protein
MRQEFEITKEEMEDIISINKSQPPVMKVGNSWSGLDLQEKINQYWEILGNKYGFNHLTVEPSSKGKLFFIAEPKPKVIPKTQEEIEMDKYNSIQKIVEQLESCKYECEAGLLINNLAFKALKKMM